MISVQRLIVTRPACEAAPFCAELAARGVAALALPLIEIAPLADAAALHEAWRSLPRLDALFFVSGSAVRHFFGSEQPPAHVAEAFLAADSRAWAVGPGTVRALCAAGVPLQRIDAPADDAPQFDSEALWRVVRSHVAPGAQVLIVRGADASGRPAGRDWLARELRAAGALVEEIAAYRRCAPAWTSAELAAARAALADGSIWLFSSSEAVANLSALLSQPAAAFAAARAVATHPRIAAAARDAGFGVVYTSRPELDELVRSIKSVR